jgi:GntR family transcriptional regulator
VGRLRTDFAIEIDKASAVPLYFQVARELERAITDGRIERGGFLGNEVELSELWQISRPTTRRAIQDLVDSGLLVRQRGVGTQVVNDALRPKARVSSLYDEMISAGRQPTTTVLAIETVPGDAWITSALGIAAGASVVYVERCRFANYRRLAIVRNWIVPSAAAGLTAEVLNSGGMYAYFRSQGIWPHYATQQVGARNASPVDAALLGLSVGAAVLTVNTTMQDRAGVKVETAKIVCDASAYSLDLTVIES